MAGVFDHLFGGHADRGFEHGTFDKMTLLILVSLGEGHQYREGRMDPRDGVAGSTLDPRLVLDVARQP